MGYPRKAVVELLIPAFLPFNLIKGGLNAAVTMLLYKPVVIALRRSHLIETTQMTTKGRLNVGVILVSPVNHHNLHIVYIVSMCYRNW